MTEPGASRRELAADRILATALDLADEEVPAFLDHACAGDEGLRALVDELLLECRAPDTLLRTAGAVGEERTLPPGERVGPWRVVREIGRGGMGVVFLAERADGQFEQQGALKVLQGPAGATAVARLARERQIVASLDHPGIARLIDGGMLAGVGPYLVLEYVEGRPLLEHCERHRLAVRDRLRLFVEVCAAVAAAHRALVVHRDIKPSNVLVTPEGRPKLLDFGIAKLVGRAGGPALTVAGSVMTPEYASPEQVRGQAITVASDVYQLGLLLYELLSGVRPQAVGARSVAEWTRAVCEDEPPPPSMARRHATGAAVLPGGRLRSSRELRGDLDTIVLQALRKEPARRYASVDHLREDVERFLAGLPIAARRDSPLYVAGKLLARHALASVVGAVALAALVATVSVYTHRLAAERDLARQAAAEARRERDRAQELGAEAREVADFLTQLFQPDEQAATPVESQTARQLLDRGAAQLQERLGGQPLTKARLLETIGGVYLQLRVLGPAEQQYQQALAVREAAQGPRHPGLVPALQGLGATYFRQIRYHEAEDVLQRALALAEARADVEPLSKARCLYLLGSLRLVHGEHAAAEELLRRALAIQERWAGPRQTELATTLNNLGVSLAERGAWEDARQAHRQALDIRQRAFGPQHSTVAQSLANLGRVELSRGDAGAALPLLRQGREIYAHRLGEEHPAVAESLGLIAAAEAALGRTAAAEAHYRQALVIRERRLGRDHPETAELQLDLASLLLRQRRLAEALPLAKTATATFAVAGEAAASDRLHSRAALVEILLRLGRVREAKEALAAAGGGPQSLDALVSELHRQGLEDAAAGLESASRAALGNGARKPLTP